MTTPWICTWSGCTMIGCIAGFAGCRRMCALLAIELLQRDVGAVEQRDHHLAVVGGAAILDDDVVAVADLLVDHRVALDAQDVGVALADEIFGHRDRFAADDRFDRPAGGDIAEQRQFDRAAAEARRDQLDRAAAVPGALDEALFLQVGEVLVDRGERREAEAAADFLEARRVAVLLDEIVEVVEDLPLAFGQWQHGAALYAKEKRKSTVRRSRLTFAFRARSNGREAMLDDAHGTWTATPSPAVSADGDEPDATPSSSTRCLGGRPRGVRRASSSAISGRSISSATASSAITKTRATWRRTSSSARIAALKSFKGAVVARHVAVSHRRQRLPQPGRREDAEAESLEPLLGASDARIASADESAADALLRGERAGAGARRDRAAAEEAARDADPARLPRAAARADRRDPRQLGRRGEGELLPRAGQSEEAAADMSHLSPTEFVDARRRHARAGARGARRARAPRAGDRRRRSRDARATRRTSTVPEPSPLFWDHFGARARRHRPPTRGRRPGWRVRGPRLASAAALVIAAVGGVVRSRHARRRRPRRRRRSRRRVGDRTYLRSCAIDAALDAANAEVWAVLTSAASDAADRGRARGRHERASAAIDGAVQKLTPDELTELGRLLQSELKRSRRLSGSEDDR